ncbi:MAG: Ig-like domain-containing protein [Cyclobacteriaceae bacterium]
MIQNLLNTKWLTSRSVSYLFTSVLILLSHTLFSQTTVNLTPSTFANQLSNISSNSTYVLADGIYTVSGTDLTTWGAYMQSNVTFEGATANGAILQYTTSDMQELTFNNLNDIELKNLHFKNIRITYQECSDSKVTGISMSDPNYSTLGDKKSYERRFLVIRGGSDNVVSGCNLNWNNSTEGKFGRGINLDGGSNHKVINCTITGYLITALGVSTGRNDNSPAEMLVDPTTNHEIIGGTFTRDPNSGTSNDHEDHGIYIHNAAYVTVTATTVTGWSTDASGHAIKLKGTNYIEIRNCTFNTSGIIIRVANNWHEANDHIWIHDNTFNDFGINSWTSLDDGYTINESCVIENNNILTGDVTASTELAASFNAFNALAQKNGGVYNNCVSNGTTLASGINESNNSTNGCTPNVNVTGVSMSANTTTIELGQTATLTAATTPANASIQTLLWSSSDEAVATVDENGKVTAISEGTATITVTTIDGGFTDTSLVTVTAPSGTTYTETLTNLDLADWGTTTFTGDNGIDWTVSMEGRESTVINGKSLTLKAQAALTSEPIPGGLVAISVKYKNPSTSVNRTIEIFVNGQSLGSFGTIGGSTETYSVNGLNISGDVIISIKNSMDAGGPAHKLDIDDIEWITLGSSSEGIEWTGSTSSDWNTAANWSTNSVPAGSDDVQIPNVSSVSGNSPVITDEQSVNNIEVLDGGMVTVNSGASLVISGSATGDGNFVINRNVLGNGGYSIVGSPVADAAVDATAPQAGHVFSYDGASFSANLTGTSTTMTPGQGYFVGSNNGGTVSFEGMVNSGQVEYDLTSSSAFHLIANPYAAAIMRSSFVTENSSDIDGAIYLWNDGGTNTGNSRDGSYVTVDVAGNVTNGSFDGNIRSGQGFFVYSSTDLSPTATFKPSMQTAVAGSNSDAGYYREAKEQHIRLTLSNEFNSDELLINLRDDVTAGLDPGYDVNKLMNTSVSFYSKIDEAPFAIQALPWQDELTIPLGFQVTSTGSYEIKLNTLSTSHIIKLKDNLTGISHDLTENAKVNLTLNELFSDGRFELVLIQQAILAAEDLKGELKVFGNSARLEILYKSDQSQAVQIYTLDGRVVYNEQVEFQSNKAWIEAELKPNQIYVLRIEDVSVKFILND